MVGAVEVAGAWAAVIVAAHRALERQGAVGSDDHRSPGTGDFHRSDHSQAWAQGTPGLFLTDTTNFRNEHYHTETDLPETLDYGFLTQVGQLVVAGAWAMAEEAE